jgi:manganese transport system permease protein
MLITPGATAFLLTRSFDRMLVVAVVLTVAASVAGIYASYYLDISTGAAVVLCQALVFAVVYLVGRPDGVLWQARRRRTGSRPDIVDPTASAAVPRTGQGTPRTDPSVPGQA